MIEISIEKFAEICNGKIFDLEPSKEIKLTAIIDSRSAKVGTFFAAFKGERVDGHDFVTQAVANGALFSLVERPVEGPHILVSNVLQALVELAKFNRTAIKNLKVIGITGSQGKTTTKDLAAHLLRVMGKTVAAKASFNNEIGVPLLLLECDETTKFCVVEMGARHTGDIAHLATIAKPQIGVALVVGLAHLGEFGSQEKIAQTKRELILGLPKDGIAILGTYDSYTPKMAEGLGLKTIFFGEKGGCDVRAADIELRDARASFDLVTPAGRAPVSLQLIGLHQIPNALAAASIATACEMPIESIAAALSTAELESKWRMEISKLGEVTLINDSYNANPDSMAAALQTMQLMAQERGGASWAILGRMHELGASEVEEHQKIGKIASEIGIDHLISVGVEDYLKGLGGGHTTGHLVANHEEALKFIEHVQAADVILVKASRAEQFNLLANEIETKLGKEKEI